MAKRKSVESALVSADLAETPALTASHDRAASPPPTEEESRLRKLQLENDRLKLENDKLAFEVERVRNDVRRGRIDLGLRAVMAIGLFWFVCWYITAVVDLAGRPTGGTRLTDAALIALFGSTAVNVIGLLLTVARYLFPGPPAKPET